MKDLLGCICIIGILNLLLNVDLFGIQPFYIKIIVVYVVQLCFISLTICLKSCISFSFEPYVCMNDLRFFICFHL